MNYELITFCLKVKNNSNLCQKTTCQIEGQIFSKFDILSFDNKINFV